MIATRNQTSDTIKQPIDVSSSHFANHKADYYEWLLEEAPVYKGKASFLTIYFLSRYEDCASLLKDPRFVRNRTTATGGSDFVSVLMPKALKLMTTGMVNQDEPAHRRLRTLVQKAFIPSVLQKLEMRIESLANELLDQGAKQGTMDIKQDYGLQISTTVIREMVGVSNVDAQVFQQGMSTLVDNLFGWKIIPTLIWQLPRFIAFVRQLIATKRGNPADDILSNLIQAEEDGDKLTDDELVTMVILLIIAGYHTTANLITNGTANLLLHPDQMAKLRGEPDLMSSAVEEIVRFSGAAYGTEMNYAAEAVSCHGVTIPKGAAVVPLIGAANRDPNVFENPNTFDITRNPNKHLGFGQGIHYCLGAPLARIETQTALSVLLNRNPNLRMSIKPEELNCVSLPFTHGYVRLPVILG